MLALAPSQRPSGPTTTPKRASFCLPGRCSPQHPRGCAARNQPLPLRKKKCDSSSCSCVEQRLHSNHAALAQRNQLCCQSRTLRSCSPCSRLLSFCSLSLAKLPLRLPPRPATLSSWKRQIRGQISCKTQVTEPVGPIASLLYFTTCTQCNLLHIHAFVVQERLGTLVAINLTSSREWSWAYLAQNLLNIQGPYISNVHMYPAREWSLCTCSLRTRFRACYEVHFPKFCYLPTQREGP